MTFEQQAKAFVKAALTRKRNPIKPATATKYESNLAYVLPLFGDRDLSEVNNNMLKTVVAKLSADGLSASTITGVVTTVKLVVASAVNDQGEQLYPRTWNAEFMDLPVIDPKSQRAPVASAEGVSRAVRQALGQDKALYALLAGTGLRIGETKALVVGPDNGVNSTWDPQTATIFVRSGLSQGEISTPKTEAGERQVDLSPELNAFLIEVLKPVSGELMFKSARGGYLHNESAYEHLKKVGVHGFHSLRRFRLTHLRKSAVRESLIKYWIGHSHSSITDLYDKIAEDIPARKEFAQKAGLGFQLDAR